MRTDFEHLYENAKDEARKSGYPDHAEDFAQWLMIKYLEGKSQHQRLRDALTDYLRVTFGNTRNQSFVYFRNLYSFHEHEYRFATKNNAETELYEKELITILFERLDERERKVFALYYEQSLAQKDVAKAMGVHESRISQVMRVIKRKFKKILKENDGLLK